MPPATLGFTIISQALTVVAMTVSLWLVAPDVLQSWLYWLVVTAYLVCTELGQEASWHWGRLRSRRLS